MTFDITEHEWCDREISTESILEEDIIIRIKNDKFRRDVLLGKRDAIALARHFKLTNNDIENI